MKKRIEDDPENLDGLSDMLPAEVLKMINELLEQLRQVGHTNQGSKFEFVYVAPGGQHVETQINVETHPGPKTHPGPFPSEARLPVAFPCLGREKEVVEQSSVTSETLTERIRHCISLLMQEKYGNEPLFNQQNHWQAVYRILVDKGYCRDSDFDGFDAFIRTVMPEEVNKQYKKESVKNISRTDFNKPFVKWKYDSETSGTRKPFDRMTAVARRFNELLEENGL